MKMEPTQDARPSSARQIAELLVGFPTEALPDEPMKHAAMLVASTLSSAALGRGIASSSFARELAFENGGAPQATVWFDSGPMIPAPEAARANALASDAAASDDSDLRSIMHCGTPLVATALALAEETGATGGEVLAAIVLGYESAGRMNDAVPGFRHKGFHGSTLATFAVVVAAGRILGVDATAMTHAIALAATSTGAISKAADTSTAREYHAGQAVASGIHAARAARLGYTAEENILDMPGGFFETYGGAEPEPARAALIADFGLSWDIVTDMAIKLVPGGHPHHALAEAAAAAVRAGGFRPDDIARITVSCPGLTQLGGPLHPRDLIDMAHSPAYFLAAGAADGTFGWQHAGSDKIYDPVIHRLIDLIEVGPEPTSDRALFRHGATVTIRTHDGRSASHTVHAPAGSGQFGIEWSNIDAKYLSLMPYSGLDPARITGSLAAIHALSGATTVRTLTELLRG